MKDRSDRVPNNGLLQILLNFKIVKILYASVLGDPPKTIEPHEIRTCSLIMIRNHLCPCKYKVNEKRQDRAVYQNPANIQFSKAHGSGTPMNLIVPDEWREGYRSNITILHQS